MKLHPAWLSAGLLLSVVVACNLSKSTSTNSSTNSSANSNTASEAGTTNSAISEAHMARDDNGEPGEEASSFGPNDHTIHVVTKLKDAKAGTKMKFSWWVVAAEGAKNDNIKDIEYTTRAAENVVHAHLTIPRAWPKGKYKVEVYVNDTLDKTIQFDVN